MTAPRGLLQIWSSLRGSRYYPLTLTSFWIERRLWDLKPLPYHAVNILLHGTNAALLFVLLRRLRVPGAWVAAALWAVHPVCAESAAWVTEMKNTQSGLFFFLTLLLYVRADGLRTDRRTDALMLACGVAAMLSKPSTVALPVVMLLIAWWQRGRWQREDWWRVAPLFYFGLAMSALTIIEQGHNIRAGGPEVALGGLQRVLLAGKVAWFYLGKVFWPAPLIFIYPRWEIDPHAWVNWLPLLAAVAVAGGLWSVRRRPWGRAGVLALGYFVLLLVPVSGLFDIYFFRFSFVADHFQYLACVGPIALAAGGGAAVVRGPRLRIVAALVVLSGLAILTRHHSHVFQSNEVLWRDTLQKNPDAWLAHGNWGLILLREGKNAEALAEFDAALRIKPDYAEAHGNRGLVLAGQGRASEALAEYTEALRLRPAWPSTLISLAWLLATSENGHIRNGGEAVQFAEQACRITDYRQLDALEALAAAYAETGRFAEAVEILQKLVRWANDNGRSKLAGQIDAQLKLYQARRPYHGTTAYPPLPE